MVSWDISKTDTLGLRWIVARMQNAAHNLLVLQTILEVDWLATFRETPVMRMG